MIDVRSFVVATVLLLGAAACSGSSPAQSRFGTAGVPFVRPAALAPEAGSPYRHIVVEIQENRSFDNLFAGAAKLKQPAGLAYKVDAATFGYNTACAKPQDVTTCQKVPLTPLAYESGVDPQHLRQYMLVECNPRLRQTPVAGASPCRMNGFWNDPVFAQSGRPVTGAMTYTYLPPSEIAPYVKLANAYGLADEMFSAARSPSFPGHVFLVSGLGPADDPETSLLQWGCSNPKASVQLFNAWTPATRYVSDCFAYRSLVTLLDAKPLSWKYYNSPPNEYDSYDGLETAVSAFDAVWRSPDLDSKLVSRDQFFDDIAGGLPHCGLPAVSWLTPNGDASDHGGWETGEDGPYWIATVYEAIARSPCYRDTALLVVWDDAGGWYDHVAPPYVLTRPPNALAGYRDNVAGFRVPLLFIASNAVPGVSNTPRDFGAILRFIEKNFGLGTLGGLDLDFNQDALQDMYVPHPKATIAPIPIEDIMLEARKPYSVQWFLHQPLTPADDE